MNDLELLDTREALPSLDVRKLVASYRVLDGYAVFPCEPATGVIYMTLKNPSSLSGHVRLRGKNEGRYPFRYLEMIDNIFGYEPNTIEVCSRSVPGKNKNGSCYTVDINPNCKPDLVTNGETLEGVGLDQFDRWRCDPPYNEHTAKDMYGTGLPNTAKLLRAGSRVCKNGALMFLLLGPTNYQACPPGVVRIGSIVISVIPNNEWRTLNIFLKTGKSEINEIMKHKRKTINKNQSLTNFI